MKSQQLGSMLTTSGCRAGSIPSAFSLTGLCDAETVRDLAKAKRLREADCCERANRCQNILGLQQQTIPGIAVNVKNLSADTAGRHDSILCESYSAAIVYKAANESYGYGRASGTRASKNHHTNLKTRTSAL